MSSYKDKKIGWFWKMAWCNKNGYLPENKQIWRLAEESYLEHLKKDSYMKELRTSIFRLFMNKKIPCNGLDIESILGQCYDGITEYEINGIIDEMLAKVPDDKEEKGVTK